MEPSQAMENLTQEDAMERLLLEYTRSYSRYYSRAESKLLQRCQEQLYQEREMGALVGQLERLFGPLKGARVLEVGSGSGSRAVAVGMAGAEVVGVEPSGAGVAAARLRARRYPHLRTQFMVAFGEKLPLLDGSFDLVFSTEVLQHVQDLQQVIAETHRVLRPGGHCYHEAPNGSYPREFHYRIFWIPCMPKPLAKLYARLRGRDPRHLDDIRFLYGRPLKAVLRRIGFSFPRDVYVEEFWQKASRPELIRSPLKRRIFSLCQRLGILPVALRAFAAVGLHPQLKIHAVKPE